MFKAPEIPNKILNYSQKILNPYSKGDFVYLPDDLSINIYIIKNGLIKIGSYSSTGKEVMFDCIFPSEFFGNLKYLEGDFFNEYAKALVNTSLIEIKVDIFKKLIQSDIEIANWFHEISTLRWYRAESRLFRIASEKPQGRISHLLPMLYEKVTDRNDKTYELIELLSYQDIADLSGLSRQSAARLIKESIREKEI
ncbi:Crp/Fnr family transcriptional regulator [Catalinimonas sp. 4WD22]|uniref:Crp/Fnr family transcriptional regulator n=1 Tax=Catalinimonas locisalis TaxID=3133978 RepID=UPI003100F30A